jgi:hypothetical protein
MNIGEYEYDPARKETPQGNPARKPRKETPQGNPQVQRLDIPVGVFALPPGYPAV